MISSFVSGCTLKHATPSITVQMAPGGGSGAERYFLGSFCAYCHAVPVHV